MQYPSTFRVQQHFERPVLDDVEIAVADQLRPLATSGKLHAGQSVAVTVGSRGIANIAPITRQAIASLKEMGAEPFIVPAMGSHGGGTAEGQRRIVESYGITEEYCGCPIRSSMETVVVCSAAEGFDVHFDKLAFEADHVLVCNRIKPHSRFAGEIESGLMKMLLIGLGKHAGATIYHSAIMDLAFGQIIRSVAGEVLANCNILGGLAIVENAFDETASVEFVAPSDFQKREKELLQLARQWMPKLPFSQMDVLLMDEIGKEISGTGFDTNVAGRKEEDDGWPHPEVRCMMVRRLSKATHGNACGIGMIDIVTRRVMDQIDLETTWINCLTGGHITAGRLPMHRDTDQATLDTALSQIGMTDPADAKLLWIKNTKKITEVECSAPFFEEAQAREDLEILTDLRPISFDDQGNLVEQF
ncbi:MAG: nickel-dependent lactate racemase [Pirellulaceae bacterium]|nr:nickel-dependent lactate racemase [Pirellulaceae bacterium]